jgi:hypothetical protein
MWNVVPLLFNGCAKLLNIGNNWNTLSYTSSQSIPIRSMVELFGEYVEWTFPGNVYRSLQHGAMHYHAETWGDCGG